jgi:hypothetical protein
VTFEEYVAIKALNFSTLKEVQRSPLHYLHRVENGREDTSSLALGRAFHTAVLEPDRFPIDYVVFHGKRRHGKDWDAFDLANTGRTILRLDEYETVLAMRDAVRRSPIAMRYLQGGRAEQTITWTERVNGVELPCKARLDYIGDAIADLKSTKDAGAREFGRTAARFGYHLQLTWYRRGARAALGLEPSLKLIAAETTKPHDVAVYTVTPDQILAADEVINDLLSSVASCRATDHWPGVGEEEQPLDLPGWAMQHGGEVDAPAFDEAETTMGDGL